MKKMHLLLLLCLISHFIFAQEIPYNSEKKIEFEEVIDYNNTLSKALVLERTEKWANSFWSDPKLINKTDNSVSYRVSNNTSNNILWAKNTYEIFYVLKVEVKDDKFRYLLTDFEIIQLGLMKFPLEKKIKKKKIKTFVWEETQKLIESLKSGISSGNIEKKDGDW